MSTVSGWSGIELFSPSAVFRSSFTPPRGQYAPSDRWHTCTVPPRVAVYDCAVFFSTSLPLFIVRLSPSGVLNPNPHANRSSFAKVSSIWNNLSERSKLSAIIVIDDRMRRRWW